MAGGTARLASDANQPPCARSSTVRAPHVVSSGAARSATRRFSGRHG